MVDFWKYFGDIKYLLKGYGIMERNKKQLKTFNDYIIVYPPEIQQRLEEIRQAIKLIVPDAKERISYNMPSFWFHGNLVYYGASKTILDSIPLVKQCLKNLRMN